MQDNLDQNIETGFLSAFHGWCYQAVIEGYREMARDVAAGFSEWEEEDISARLAKESQDLKWVKKKKIKIIPEVRLYDDDVYTGKKKAKSTRRIDFLFTNWFGEEDYEYYAEAKNLYQADRRRRGDANESKKYYVNGGIERFVSGAYPLGFLLGYVLRGEIDEVIRGINQIIDKKRLLPRIGHITSQSTLHSHPFCYTSTNTTSNGVLDMRHIFLKF